MKFPSDIKTRKCRKSDYGFVYKVTKQTLVPILAKYVKQSKKVFDEGFDKNYKYMMIILKGKRKIGFYQLKRHKSHLEIIKIFFSPAYHGKGYGKMFMNYFETLGYKKIKLEVWENNPAVKFYKKLGYRKIGKKNHKIFMEKKILYTK